MSRDKDWALHQDAEKKQGPLALKNALELNLPKEIKLPDNLVVFGEKTGTLIIEIKKLLIDKFGNSLPEILAVALHEYWFSCCHGAAYIALCIDNGAINDNEKMRKISVAKGYGDCEGWANTLSNGFADITPSFYRVEFIKQATGHDILDRESALYCMALQWFHKAAKLFSEGKMDLAFDALHEANDALICIRHYETWDEAYKLGTDDSRESSASAARTALARAAAEKSHIETRALKEEVRKHWEENIGPGLTNDDAASILIKEFPLKFRTLSGYVSDFKKAVC